MRAGQALMAVIRDALWAREAAHRGEVRVVVGRRQMVQMQEEARLMAFVPLEPDWPRDYPRPPEIMVFARCPVEERDGVDGFFLEDR